MRAAEIVLIALGLSMDAFAVSITLGLSVPRPTARHIVTTGLLFGFFQALMPAIGYAAGVYFAAAIQSFDHWIAFVLLGLIGGNMIKESLSREREPKARGTAAFQPARMLALSIATSIDALAVGIPFALLRVNILTAVSITGPATFVISMGGVALGNLCGARFKAKAELAGGAVLIALGVKILVEHLFFG